MTTNKELAEIFRKMAAAYEFINDKNKFRALAYEKASLVISNLQEDIRHYIENDQHEKLAGIGESITLKIKEYLKTGKIKTFEELKKEAPEELIDLVGVKGFGPKSLHKIYKELGIKTKKGLTAALKNGTIGNLEGFGQKKTESMLKGLQLHTILDERILLWDALNLGETLVQELKKMSEVRKVELAGSLRRKKETIGDIDILVAAKTTDKEKIIEHFTTFDNVKEILAKGDTKASIIIKDFNRQVDLRIVEENEWGSALQYFTGSKEHNVHLRTIAKKKSLKISEYGVFETTSDKKIAGGREEEIYKALGYKWMPPEMREDKGEIELSEHEKIPKLISLEDLKGDLHMHSNWTDGTNTIEEIVEYVNANYTYEYIALTDHTKALRVAGGMDEKQFLKQIKAIKEINKKLGKDFIKAGAEVDILADGSMDLSDELLSQLDWVVGSIHSGFNRNNTDRLIKACQNPYVCAIGHPSGRLIGTREAYELDMEEVLKTAKATGTAMEINTQPNRMDLNDDAARRARELGVKLVINTDSHQLGSYASIQLGVYIAKRAWCTANDILNTKSWKEVQEFVNKKRKSKVLATS